jgi:hypothetical protein
MSIQTRKKCLIPKKFVSFKEKGNRARIVIACPKLLLQNRKVDDIVIFEVENGNLQKSQVQKGQRQPCFSGKLRLLQMPDC